MKIVLILISQVAILVAPSISFSAPSCTRVFPGSPWKITIPISFQMQSAKKSQRAGEHKKAIGFLLIILKSNPNDVQALSAIGKSFYATGRYDLAVEAQRRAAILGGDNSFNYNDLAMSLIAHGRIYDALDTTDKAIEIDPRDSKTYTIRADAFLRIEQPEKTIDALDTRQTYRSDDVTTLTLRGRANLMLNQPIAALEAFDSALAIRFTALVMSLKAQALIASGSPEQALGNLDNILESPSILWRKAHAYYALGQFEQAYKTLMTYSNKSSAPDLYVIAAILKTVRKGDLEGSAPLGLLMQDFDPTTIVRISKMDDSTFWQYEPTRNRWN